MTNLTGSCPKTYRLIRGSLLARGADYRVWLEHHAPALFWVLFKAQMLMMTVMMFVMMRGKLFAALDHDVIGKIYRYFDFADKLQAVKKTHLAR